MKRIILILLGLLFFKVNFIFSQKTSKDSVLTKLKTEKTDSVRFKLFFSVSKEDFDVKVYSSILDSCLAIAGRLKSSKYLMYSYSKTGTYWFDRGNNKKALTFYFKGADISKVINNKSYLSKFDNNIANCYDVLGNYDKALSYYFAIFTSSSLFKLLLFIFFFR